MACAKKMKISDRLFNPAWENEFFFKEITNGCQCLICDAKITILKRSNLNDHFSAKHSNYNTKYPLNTESRSIKIASLKLAKESAEKHFKTFVYNDNQNSAMASLKVSWAVAQAKKPYSDVDLIKKCALILVDEVTEPSEKRVLTKIDNVPLSADTATRRVSDCIDNVNNQLMDKIQDSASISLAIDETTDTRDISQCAIFVRLIDNNFEITEDLLHLAQLKGQTRGEDIYNEVLDTLNTFKVPLKKIYSLSTDGAPAMSGCNIGFTTLFKNSEETRDDILTYHCIIHQENLAALRSNMFDNVMDDVVQLVKFIHTNSLNHRQFRTLLAEYNTHYAELVRHTNVRWLSKGRVLDHFYHLLDPIKTFLSEHTKLPVAIQEITPRLQDKQWIERVAFLADVTQHLNDLNLQLQGKEKFIMDMYSAITAFENKLLLFKSHFETKKVIHFERLKNLNTLPGFRLQLFGEFASCIDDLRKEFKGRFAEFRAQKNMFSLVSNPYHTLPDELEDCVPDEILPAVQMELIELHSNDVLKRVLINEGVLAFWKKAHFQHLSTLAKIVLSMFGSTYRCELAFSSLTFIKNKYRNKLSDVHTSELLKASITDIEPNFVQLAKDKQYQSTH